MSQEFGDRLKHRRQELNMTQSDVARAADLTPAAISQFEGKEHKPSFDTLVKLSEVLRVTTDYLIGKKELRLDDLLTDPRISEMLEGMQHFSKRKKEILCDIYETLKIRSESSSRNSSNRAIASFR